MMRETMASRAILIFVKDPIMCIFVSATTTLVLLAFSIANRVLPSFPAILPIARER